MTESITQRLFAALNKNKSVYLNDYEVMRISGLSEDELEQAVIDLEEILKESDTSIVVDKNTKDRTWKMVAHRKKIKIEEEKQVGLF